MIDIILFWGGPYFIIYIMVHYIYVFVLQLNSLSFKYIIQFSHSFKGDYYDNQNLSQIIPDVGANWALRSNCIGRGQAQYLAPYVQTT